HAFDTSTFDPKGEVDEGSFGRIFARAAEGRGRVARDEFIAFVRSNPDRKKPDAPAPLLRFFAWAEAMVFFCVAGTRGGGARTVPRARLRRFYDGSVFFAVERRRRLEAHLGRSITSALRKTR
ncbi:MAG TPA: caleosin family protein, partial [Minicystis sp.]|nr:caleosin family protein [Minicystis sp.]